MSHPDDQWHEILDADEHILWQGRPDTAFAFKPSMLATLIFGIFFSGFALFWIIGASQAGGNFWMFGLIHFFAGVGVALTPFVWPSFQRRHTWYTLTNKRGLIATNIPFVGRRLRSYPINDTTVIEYAPGAFASVYFGHRKVIRNDRRKIAPDGFERINDGQEVMKLIRAMQDNTPPLS